MSANDCESRDRGTEEPSLAALTVYYDGSCPLCATEIAYYASREGGRGLRLVDVSEASAAMENDLDRDAAMRRFHVRQPDGTLLSGAAAFAEIWQVLPGWRPAGRVARFRPATVLLETGYRLFLPLRPFLSRLARRWAS